MDDLRESLSEGLSDSQCEEYAAYALRLRQIESADYVFCEQVHHDEKLHQIFGWLQEGVKGTDTLGELVADHRRKRDLCKREIARRERAGAFPPSGKVFVDYGDARGAIKVRTVEVIHSYTPLQKRGKEFWGLCPFHDDHHPSLRVNAEKQVWFCDPCGVGGDVFDFIARVERLNHAK